MNYTEAFDKAFEILLKHEGGYVLDERDSGGETKYGISKATYPKLKISTLTQDEAKKIYYKDFWLANKCNLMPPSVATKYFDICVNTGAKQATKILQRAIRATGTQLVEDGILGPKTLGALQDVPPTDEKQFVSAMRSEAACFYKMLVSQDQSKRFFLRGWLTRAYA